METTRRKAILLVEDDPTVRHVAAELLRDEGYEVVEATDGRDAIGALRAAGPPDDRFGLVILDMKLPEADGVQVLRAIADLGRHVPIIATSADHGQLHHAGAFGAAEVLPKPYELTQLLDVVARNCAR